MHIQCLQTLIGPSDVGLRRIEILEQDEDTRLYDSDSTIGNLLQYQNGSTWRKMEGAPSGSPPSAALLCCAHR